ncbi:MAG: hypothetical protein IJK89_13215 [Clostridia bacterium]|nr:hypothetical protein [Clostridia bacterium]
MTKKIIALLLTLCMAAACASCATITISIPVEIATAQNGAADTTAAPAATEPAQTTEQPAVPVDNTEQTPSPDVPADVPSGAPSTTAEVLKYYCDAYNKIASESKAVTRTYDYTSNYNNILNINNNSTLEGLANSLMGKFMVENTDPVAGDASALPPVGLTSLNITEDKVSSATCTDKGDTYEIVIKSTGTDDNQEADLNPGDGSAGLIGPLLRTDDVTGAAGSLISFEGLHAYYATASVTATVDKATGHITKFEYLTPCILHFDQVTAAVIVKVKNCDIGLLFQQTWTVDY